MHEIHLRVRDHAVEVASVEGTLVEGCVEHWTLHVDFDEEWTALDKTVTFSNRCTPVTVPFEQGMDVPWETIVGGSLRFSFVGTAEDGVETVTTKHMRDGVFVHTRGEYLGEPAREATKDVVAQARERLEELSVHVADAGVAVEQAQQAAADARLAGNEAVSAAYEATTAAVKAVSEAAKAKLAAEDAGRAADAAESATGAAELAASNADAAARRASDAAEEADATILVADAAAEMARQAASDLRAAAERGDFDGVSPTATVSKSGRTTTVTLTDARGTTTAEVLDGEPGSDYVLTDADKAEIAAMVPVPPGGVTDVTLAGTSLVQDGVAEIPVAANGAFGVVKAGLGITASANGTIYTSPAQNSLISSRVAEDGYSVSYNNREVITPSHLDYAVRAAMCDGKGAAWSQAECAACRERIGDAPWELVETITLTEDVQAIERTVTPSGQAYDFRDVLVKIETAAAAAAGTLAIGINGISQGYIANAVNTAKRHLLFRASVEGGRLFTMNTTPGSSLVTSNSWSGRVRNLGVEVAETISTVYIAGESAAKIPTDSVITIYGRKW